MGCCFSCDEDKDSLDAGREETSRLLSNPVSGEDGRASRPVPNYNTVPATHSHMKGDEQSALNRILDQAASDVIDVSAIDTQTMEHNEYMERARDYSTRLALGQSQKLRTDEKLPAGVAAPQVVLAAAPVSLADIQMITNAAENASRAVSEVKVKHKEDLVVPFGVP